MTKAAIQQALQTAANLAQTGRAPEAESIYRQVLAAHPQQPQALSGYGLLLHAAGHHAAAAGLLRQAVTLQPNDADIRVAHGATAAAVGQLPEAEAAFRRAIELRPGLVAAHENLASVLSFAGRHADALAAAQRAVTLAPKSYGAWCVVAQSLLALGRLDETVAAADRAIQAIAPQPAYRAFELAGHALMGTGRSDEAIEAYKRSVSPQPGFAIAYSNLGNALQQRARVEEGMIALEMAIKLDPNLPDARNNYGNALKDLARLDEACDQYRLAVKLRPETALFGSNLVYAMWFRQACDPAEVLAESRAWAAFHAEPLTRVAPPNTNDRNPDRVIRVGLISPDFRFHPVGRLIAPLIVHHNRAEIAIVLFSGVIRPDALTQQMYGAADEVVDVRGATDDQLAAAARAARIDVLVDLQVHMSGTRLKAFAQRPAPVQVTYLGYCATTGMSAMDYVLTDRTLDPWDGPDPAGGAPSPIHSERLLHLDGCYWCYSEPPDLPEPNPLPAAAVNGGAGHVRVAQQLHQTQRRRAERVGRTAARRAEQPAVPGRSRRGAPPAGGGQHVRRPRRRRGPPANDRHRQRPRLFPALPERRRRPGPLPLRWRHHDDGRPVHGRACGDVGRPLGHGPGGGDAADGRGAAPVDRPDVGRVHRPGHGAGHGPAAVGAVAADAAAALEGVGADGRPAVCRRRRAGVPLGVAALVRDGGQHHVGRALAAATSRGGQCPPYVTDEGGWTSVEAIDRQVDNGTATTT